MNDPEHGTEAWARWIQPPYTTAWRNAPHDPAYCCASVHNGGRSVSFHQCNRKPKVHYGALGYCGQHDPAAVVAKREARDAKWRAKWDSRDKARDDAKAAALLRENALSAIRKIAEGHNDPRSLAIEVLSKEISQ